MLKRFLSITFALLALCGTCKGELLEEIRWVLDTWEVCSFDFGTLGDKVSFSEGEIRKFSSDADRYAQIWFYGWLILPLENSAGFRVQEVVAEKDLDGVYLNLHPEYQSFEDGDQAGEIHYRRVAFWVVIDQKIVSAQEAVVRIFSDMKPRLQTYYFASWEKTPVEDAITQTVLINSEANEITERRIPIDYFEHMKAEIVKIYPVLYDEEKVATEWYVDFRVYNEKYNIPIKGVHNFNQGDKDPYILRNSDYAFFADLEYIKPDDSGRFSGRLEYEKIANDKSIEEIRTRLLADELSCQISFEPLYNSRLFWYSRIIPYY